MIGRSIRWCSDNQESSRRRFNDLWTQWVANKKKKNNKNSSKRYYKEHLTQWVVTNNNKNKKEAAEDVMNCQIVFDGIGVIPSPWSHGIEKFWMKKFKSNAMLNEAEGEFSIALDLNFWIQNFLFRDFKVMEMSFLWVTIPNRRSSSFTLFKVWKTTTFSYFSWKDS